MQTHNIMKLTSTDFFFGSLTSIMVGIAIVALFTNPKTTKTMKAKIALKRNFVEQPINTIRGELTDYPETASTITIRGRQFQEIYNSNGDYIERPLSEHICQYQVPLSSVRYIQIIEEGTESDKIDKEVNQNKTLKK